MVSFDPGTRPASQGAYEEANSAYGLTPIKDPVPEQNIFERSDHFNFAKKGVPCVLYGMGTTSFDEEIQQYYHQVTDEFESLDMDYVTKYYYTFVLSGEKIANSEKKPFWVEGDKYEQAGKDLYGLE